MLAREPNEERFPLLWIFLCLYKHTVTTWSLLSCIFVKLLIAKNGAIPSKVKLELDLLPAVYALVSNVTNLFWFEINGIWTYGVNDHLKLLWNSLIIKHCCIILSTLLNLYRINWILTKQQSHYLFGTGSLFVLWMPVKSVSERNKGKRRFSEEWRKAYSPICWCTAVSTICPKKKKKVFPWQINATCAVTCRYFASKVLTTQTEM